MQQQTHRHALPIELERPLAVFDLEATGVSPRADRIVEISVVLLLPGGRSEARTFRVNPGIPIPPEASAIHGIRDEELVEEMTSDGFEVVARYDDWNGSGNRYCVVFRRTEELGGTKTGR